MQIDVSFSDIGTAMVSCGSGTLDYGPLDEACDKRHTRQPGTYLDVQQSSPASAQQQVAQISLTLYISGGTHWSQHNISDHVQGSILLAAFS